MVVHPEPRQLGDLVIQVLKIFQVVDVHEFMAARALHMIMLRQHMVVAVGRPGHGHTPQEAAFHEGIQIPVHRSFTDIRVVQDDAVVHLFRCRVVTQRADRGNDQLPLDRIPFLKHRHLLHSQITTTGSFSPMSLFLYRQ